MNIRDATATDAPLLLAAAVRLTEEAGGGVADVRIEPEDLRRQLEAQVARALVAEVDGDFAGLAFYSFVHFSLSGLHLYLDDLYVEPDFRNAGLGRRFMASLADRALAQGCVGMTWQVEHDNSAGIRFYERLGARLAPDRRVMMVGNLQRLVETA